MVRYWAMVGPAMLLGGLLGSEAAVQARPHGGGGGGRGGVAVGGGARVGGFRVGGVSAAGFRVGGVSAAGFRVGGTRAAVVGVNAFGRPIGRFYPYRRFNSGFYGGWFPWGWGWGYPLASSYDYVPAYDYVEPAAITSAGYYSPPSPDLAVQPETPPAQQPGDDTAHLMVLVSENAQLWFDGSLTNQRGNQREFVTPPLTPGKNYIYDLRARWMQDGRPYEAKRTVYIHANDWLQIDLTRPTTLPTLPRP